MDFAKTFTIIDDEEIEIISHACKSILVHDGETWRKTNSIDLFDVPMGSYHGAEVCDLIGLYILHKLSNTLPEFAYGLYRDDGLGVVDIATGCHLERLKKSVRKCMLDLGFKITIEIGCMRTNFLDVMLDLHEDNYAPYRKPNSSINYIHKSSNHPAHIKRRYRR